MSATSVASKSEITLRGSVKIVTEFFAFAINSILYQRAIYPPDAFTATTQYGLSMMVTTDDGLKHYLTQVLTQLSAWLVRGEVQKFVVVITGADTKVVLERWVFNVETDKSVRPDGPGKEKGLREIQSEIQAIIRQITSSVSFLPMIDEPCTFDLLVYTDQEAEVPRTWEESDPKYVANSEEVRLRSFTTKVHKVDAMVSYRVADDGV